jgi:pyrroloquinoline-quinone synthase
VVEGARLEIAYSSLRRVVGSNPTRSAIEFTKEKMMSRIEELREIIDRYDLNKHPFYQDWRMGTLPVEKLKRYANDYGHFVATIPAGWETIGESEIAAEERVHHDLWCVFQKAIESDSTDLLPQSKNLRDASATLYSTAPEALGALYAFEFQQPKTATSKFDGLREHYAVSEEGQEYFRVHMNDWSEPELLEKRIEKLSESEFARAKTACAVAASSMWLALDGIYYEN